MGQALYRKYRSKNLAEIIGQEHITETLQKALAADKLSHAYLFTGPRGVGKTSIARILAHEINGIPYTDDSMHMDIIEIDAASNRRIDEIRELRDKVYVAPTSAKYKVYIIDEVHMLTREAFNALLKTLEEPPAHVVFILATTDAHKLPETIISRTQRYSFKPVETNKVVAHLREIAIAEHIEIDDASLTLLAEHGEGSFRDSISMLDQAGSRGASITTNDVQQLLGIPSQTAVDELIIQLASTNNPALVMQQLTILYDQGFQAAAIAKQLAQHLRSQLVKGTLQFDYETVLRLLERLLSVPMAQDSNRLLEIILLENITAPKVMVAAPARVSAQPQQIATASHAPAKLDAATIPAKKAALADLTTAKAPEPKLIEAAEAIPVESTKKEVLLTVPPSLETTNLEAPKAPAITEMDAQVWQDVLNSLKKQHNTLYGLARMAEPDFSQSGTISLCFQFDFHRKQLTEAKNQQKLQTIIHQVTGKKIKIECTVNKQAKPAAATISIAPKLDALDIANISNIFGGGELIE